MNSISAELNGENVRLSFDNGSKAPRAEVIVKTLSFHTVQLHQCETGDVEPQPQLDVSVRGQRCSDL